MQTRLMAMRWILAVFLGAAPAWATTVLDMSVGDLARQSPVVIQGVVGKQRVEWNEDHSLIVTRTRVRVDRSLKGAVGDWISVRQVGGSLDGVAMGPQGDATFRPGEEVVLFLEPHPSEQGAYVLVSMAASKFTVRQTPSGPVAERDLEGLAFARRDADGVIRPASPQSPARIALDTLLRTIAPSQR